MHIDISLIPHDVAEICKKAATVTSNIKAGLHMNLATDLAALVPGGGDALAKALAACDMANKIIGLIQHVADDATINGIFQRLGADLTMIAHDNEKHTISYYIEIFEVIFHDVFGKQ